MASVNVVIAILLALATSYKGAKQMNSVNWPAPETVVPALIWIVLTAWLFFALFVVLGG